MTNLIELLSTAYTSQNWELVKEAVLLVAGEDFPLAEPQAAENTPDMEAIVAAVLAQMNQKSTTTKTPLPAKPSSKKKIDKPTFEDNEDNEEPSSVVNVVIKNKQSNAGKSQGPVEFKNGFNPTLVSTDVIASEQRLNKKMSTKVIKDARDPVNIQMVKCDRCPAEFDFTQVYPMGKITKESEIRCPKCQIQR